MTTLPAGYVLRHATSNSNKTIIVTGLARSGTSMLSQILHEELEVWMGNFNSMPSRHYPVYEDCEIVGHASRGKWEDLEKEARKRDKEKGIWGFKHPIVLDDPSNILSRLTNPHIILSFRDPVAILGRELRFKNQEHSETSTKCQHLRTLVQETKRLYEFMHSCKYPLLVISHERAKESREETVKLISRFVWGK